jgi:predicted permease
MLRRSRLDDDLAEEIRLHINLRRQALIDEGMDPRDADARARRMFGNATAIREETRDMWGFPSFETLVQDLRYGARLLRRSPAFTATAVVSLAIGIGASAAVFSLANTVLFRKLPVPRPDDLVVVRWVNSGGFPFASLNGYASQTGDQNSSTSFSLTAFESIRKDTADLLDTFGFADLYRVNVSADGRPETESAQVVSGNYYSALGVTAAAGRTITESDMAPGAPPVAVISYAYWQRRFGGSPEALGSALVVNKLTFTVVGVAQRGFQGTLQVSQDPAVTLPLSAYGPITRDDSPDNPDSWWVLMMGRLKPEVTVVQVQPRLDAIVKRTVMAARPTAEATSLPRVVVDPGAAGQTEDRETMREPLKAMAFVVIIVLLVACANVSTLLLARGRARQREVAVRVAIGAPRRRIVRQLLTESLLLATLGSTLGLALASWLAAALAPALTSRGSGGSELSAGLDWTVVGFTVLLAFGCSILFGLAPSLRSTDVRIAPGLREAGRGAAAVGQRNRLGSALVVVQVSLSMLLLSAAGLLAFSVRNLQGVSPGFDPRNVLVFGVDPQQNGYDEVRTRQVLDTALERLRALPGVRGASVSSHRLIANSSSIGSAARLDEPRPDLDSGESSSFMQKHSVWRQVVDETFLDTMGIPVLRGRGLSVSDTKEAAAAAVINEALAKQLFGTSEVVGRQFVLGLRSKDPVQIVGVAADARYTSMRRNPPPTVYLSWRQQPLRSATFEVRTSSDAAAFAATVREAMREIDPALPLVNLRTQDDQIIESLTEERLFAGLATLLGIVTLLLSGIGVYGLLAYSVARRTQEIGVRMALGAERTTVRWMVLKQSLTLAGAGLALGIPAAIFGTRFVESMLYGLTARDPSTVATAALVMALVALAAAYVPARRASRVDPIVALRAE